MPWTWILRRLRKHVISIVALQTVHQTLHALHISHHHRWALKKICDLQVSWVHVRWLRLDICKYMPSSHPPRPLYHGGHAYLAAMDARNLSPFYQSTTWKTCVQPGSQLQYDSTECDNRQHRVRTMLLMRRGMLLTWARMATETYVSYF